MKEMHIAVSYNEGPKGLVAPIKLNQFHSQYCTIAQPSVESDISIKSIFSQFRLRQFMVNFFKININHF